MKKMNLGSSLWIILAMVPIILCPLLLACGVTNLFVVTLVCLIPFVGAFYFRRKKLKVEVRQEKTRRKIAQKSKEKAAPVSKKLLFFAVFFLGSDPTSRLKTDPDILRQALRAELGEKLLGIGVILVIILVVLIFGATSLWQKMLGIDSGSLAFFSLGLWILIISGSLYLLEEYLAERCGILTEKDDSKDKGDKTQKRGKPANDGSPGDTETPVVEGGEPNEDN